MTEFLLNPSASTPPQVISCTTCAASCCRLEVMLMGEDDVPRYLSAEDQWGGTVMRQLDDGWCAALDRQTMRCTIYERRPEVCRDYEMGADDCLIEYTPVLIRLNR